jgi:hypothetical protein
MPMQKISLANVNDVAQANASESLSGSVVYDIENIGATPTFVFEAKARLATVWLPIQALNLGTGTLVLNATVAGLYKIDASGALDTRVRQTVAGTADVFIGLSLG